MAPERGKQGGASPFAGLFFLNILPVNQSGDARRLATSVHLAFSEQRLRTPPPHKSSKPHAVQSRAPGEKALKEQ